MAQLPLLRQLRAQTQIHLVLQEPKEVMVLEEVQAVLPETQPTLALTLANPIQLQVYLVPVLAELVPREDLAQMAGSTVILALFQEVFLVEINQVEIL